MPHSSRKAAEAAALAPLTGPARRMLMSGAAVLLLAGLVAAGPAHAQQQAAPPVSVAAPVARQVAQWAEHTARIEASAHVEIRPRVSGEVVAVHFKDGAMVRAGDRLFTIDPRPFRIAVEAAEAELARAQARQVLADQQVARVAPLVRNRVATEAELDTRVSAQREARAAVAAAQAALQQAQLELEFTEIRAPRAGRVSDRRVDAGNQVQQGVTLMTTLVALDPIYVSFDASESDYLRYARLARAAGGTPAAGALAELRLLDETAFSREGRVDFMDSSFDARSGTIRARAVVANPDLFLTPGTLARLRVSVGEAAALLVPDAAIMADQSGRVVLTVAPDGTVAPRPVQLGPLADDGLRIVRSGLTAEDRVIVAGLHRARPGTRVTPQETTLAQAPVAAHRSVTR